MEKSRENEILKILSVALRRIFSSEIYDYNKLQEIRLRMNEPLIVIYDNREYFVTEKGKRTTECKKAYMVAPADIRETLEYISNYSLYAYEDEIRQGFITIQGGHRVGLAGKVILESGMIKSVRHISFINIRLSHQVKGCCKKVLPYIINGNETFHTLIISPPRCGKTTLLRDMIRMLSDGFPGFKGNTIGVVDERSEIGACYKGVPQNDIGIRTDILDCCPKSYGMLMLIRSMSPQIIAVDEIGSRDDIDAIYSVINCGCKLIATVHGNSIDDIRNRPGLRKLVDERVFERYIVLSNRKRTGEIRTIFDDRGSVLFMAEDERLTSAYENEAAVAELSEVQGGVHMLYIKILGMLLVVTASYGIGKTIGVYQNRRVEDIYELLIFVRMANGHLAYSASEITEIIREGSDKAGGRIGDWLAGLALQFRTEEYASSFEQIWTGSIGSLMEYSYLTDAQIGAVKELGKWLCYMDIDMQIRNLKLWEQNMQTEYEEQKDRAHRINKVSRSLGLLGGIFLIILIG